MEEPSCISPASLGSPYKPSAGGRNAPTGRQPCTRAPNGSRRDPPASGYSLGKKPTKLQIHNTKIKMNTNSSWRLAEQRKQVFSLLPQAPNHKDMANLKREEQTVSSLALFQLRMSLIICCHCFWRPAITDKGTIPLIHLTVSPCLTF